MPDPQEQVNPITHLTVEQLERLRATFNANLDPQPGRPVEPQREARWDWELEMDRDWQRAAQAAPPPPAPDAPALDQLAGQVITRAEVRTGRRTRRDTATATQAPPPVQRGDRLTYTRVANLTPPAPQQPQPRIPIQVGAFTGAEFRDNSLWITAEFVEGTMRTPLDFGVYADTGRALAPYAHEALKRIAEILRDINNLPEPRRREIPNATVGERMFNMIQLLMDKAEVSEQVQNEWQALAMEYERHMGGGGLR